MASSEIEPTGISALELIAALQQASGLAAPDETVDINMDIDGCFRVSWANANVLISDQGDVTGSGEIAASELRGLVGALPKHIGRHLTGLDELGVPEFS